MEVKEFEELIGEFVGDNFMIEGLCNGCSDNCPEILPDDYKGSYDKAIKELYMKMIGWKGIIENGN